MALNLIQLYRCCAFLVALSLIPGAPAKPIVDPGLFVIQGVSSCINGTGYCMLGSNCSVDVDFLPGPSSDHCKGLRDAFTPKIDFVCCMYNPLGKATSKPPTTTINTFTITDVFSLIDEEVAQQNDDFPEDANPENFIDIVGVVTDVTGIIGLVTRPWTGTFPTRATSPTTTPMTPSTPTTTLAPASPGTPADVDQIMAETTTEDPTTDSPTETTESYNEVPTEIDEPSMTNQQEVQVTQQQQQETTTTATSQTSEEEEEEEEEQEVAHVAVIINNELPSSQTSPVTVSPVTSGDLFNENAIIFPDNPIVSLLPPLETEALEAETESIVHVNIIAETVHSSDVASSSAINGQVSNADHSQQGSQTGQETQQQPSAGITAAEHQDVNNLPGQHDGPTDYEYYEEYPDQLLLQPVNQNICGFKGFKNYIGDVSSSRILGGVAASTVEWCWVAAIMERRQSGDKYVCSGALVESDLVVTTAACLRRLESRDLSDYIVVLGDSNLKDELPYGLQFHGITEIVLHPEFLTSGGAHANDIGVVRLRDHATLSDNVCLICMAQQDAIFPTQSCTVTGYGVGDVPKSMLRDVMETVPSEGVLRQMSVPILKTPACETALHNITGSEILATSGSFLCAGGLDGANACYSTMDGGSPLACEAGGRWFLAGVVSWTRECESQGVPNVYTRVSSFSNWLQATHLRMMGFLTHQVRLA